MAATGGSGRRGIGRKRPSVRRGGSELRIFNSGLEVWLYDETQRDAIRASGALSLAAGADDQDGKLRELARQGRLVGYGLLQDDEVAVAVHVGEPLSAAELDVAPWLEPQTAFLRLPSGTLCVETNDASRIGPSEPTDPGGVVEVPPGDYRLTLYRIDHEALEREGRVWHGAHEVVVLTPGGVPADAAEGLLPFEPRRERSWIGRYEIRGRRAEALVWFSDFWDTFVVNLDSAAVAQLALAPGAILRVEVPAVPITLTVVFASSWDDAQRHRPPPDVPLEESGCAALSPMADWDGAEALFCRRVRTRTCVEGAHQALWLPARVEVLEAEAVRESAAARAARSLAGGARALVPTDLRGKEYFDPGFLGLILSDLLPEVSELDELPLPDALDRIDAALAEHGAAPAGDLEWEEVAPHGAFEQACRLYLGLPEGLAAVLAREGSFELLFLSELQDGSWLATGLADDLDARVAQAREEGTAGAAVTVQARDEELASLLAAHREALDATDARPVAPPGDLAEAATRFARFLGAALDA